MEVGGFPRDEDSHRGCVPMAELPGVDSSLQRRADGAWAKHDVDHGDGRVDRGIAGAIFVVLALFVPTALLTFLVGVFETDYTDGCGAPRYRKACACFHRTRTGRLFHPR